ncbi:MAG: DUF2807 domain-containing protein [Acidimicrobiia bacterium]
MAALLGIGVLLLLHGTAGLAARAARMAVVPWLAFFAAYDGVAGEVELRAEGGAAVDLEDMVVQIMDITMDGGSTATVNTSLKVTGQVTGGAILTLANSPATRDLDVSGGGKVSG